MTTVEVRLPDDVAARLNAEDIASEELSQFLVVAIEAWLKRRQVQRNTELENNWSEAFQDSSLDFVDQLIEENRTLFEELARL